MRSPSAPGTITLPRHKGPWHKFRVLGLSPTGHRNFPARRQNKPQPAREAESCSDPQGSSTLLQTHLSFSNSRPSLNPPPKLSPSELGPGPGKAGYPGTHGNFLFCCSNSFHQAQVCPHCCSPGPPTGSLPHGSCGKAPCFWEILDTTRPWLSQPQFPEIL